MRKLTHVELALENVEAVKFDAVDIKMIFLDNVSESLYFNSSTNMLNSQHCEKFALVLKPSGNKLENSGGMYPDWLPFKRLTYHKDIVSISLNYDDETKEEIYVPYEEVAGGNNLFQSSFIDEEGSLHILSSETEKAEEYFQ